MQAEEEGSRMNWTALIWVVAATIPAGVGSWAAIGVGFPSLIPVFIVLAGGGAYIGYTTTREAEKREK